MGDFDMIFILTGIAPVYWSGARNGTGPV